MKYKDIFKSRWFWLSFILILVWSLISNYREYGYLFISEILGLVLASLFLSFIFGSVWFGIYKIFYRNKKT